MPDTDHWFLVCTLIITMHKNKINYRERHSGQSLVEFAITLMVILLLVSGAVDFGLGFFSFVAIRDAAQEGALYGSIASVIDTNNNGIFDPGEQLNEAGIVTRVRNSSRSPVNLQDLSTVDVRVLPIADPICQGKLLTVTITYDYPVSMALINLVTGPTIQIKASATSTILKPACPAP